MIQPVEMIKVISMATSARITPQVARGERAARELAKRRLALFGQYMMPEWTIAPHQKLVCDYLEQVEVYIATHGRKGIGRLIIEMPPQHTKTTWASQMFPGWLLGRRPDSNVILTSYGADLATENSRKVRNLILGERYKNIFGNRSALREPVELAPDSRSNTSWNLDEPYRGGVVAAGVGGGITGRPADLLVIDDPFKNRQEADSLQHRKTVLQWYGSSALSRVRAGTAIVIMHTRWHRLDLTGELLRASIQDPLADQYTVLCMPALAYEPEEYAKNMDEQRTSMREGIWRNFEDPLGRQPGEPLWPAEFDREMLDSLKASLESQGSLGDWYALYQQQPRPQEGAFFGAGDFKLIDRAPDGLSWVRYNDLAVSEARAADFNASVAEAVDKDANLYLRGMIRVKGWDEFAADIKSAMLSPAERGTDWGFETNAFQMLAFKEFIKDKDLIGISIRGINAEKDKVTRARPIKGRAKAGKVFLVRGPWNEAFIAEAVDFWTGLHDDQIDSASGGLEMLETPKTIRLHVGHAKKKVQA
jgi:predicted phage terminase large subunit-like protein